MSMAEWICEQCELGFSRDSRGHGQIARFCGQPCYHAWRKANGIITGQFKPGLIPWNKGKYMRVSRRTEFKKGQRSITWAPIGTVRVRRRRRDGQQHAWVKVGEPATWKPRANVVWEKWFKSVPKGCILHHIDRDTMNDAITNLACLSRASHLKEHKHEFESKRKQAALSARRRSQGTKTIL